MNTLAERLRERALRFEELRIQVRDSGRGYILTDYFDAEKIAADLREAAAAIEAQQGMVSVPEITGMLSVFETVGKRLHGQLSDRFALTNPIQFTDNERQVLVRALRVLLDALAAHKGKA